MKTRFQDHLLIAMAFCTVMLCGYGIGFLLGARHQDNAAELKSESTAWCNDALHSIEERLNLRPEQVEPIQQELIATEREIEQARADAVYRYLWSIHGLYDRMDDWLDPDQAAVLRAEKQSLEAELEKRIPHEKSPKPH
ncbi:MAG: hypothetical protein ACO3RV_08970 [Luteolibacter sp.]